MLSVLTLNYYIFAKLNYLKKYQNEKFKTIYFALIINIIMFK